MAQDEGGRPAAGLCSGAIDVMMAAYGSTSEYSMVACSLSLRRLMRCTRVVITECSKYNCRDNKLSLDFLLTCGRLPTLTTKLPGLF